MFIIIAIAILVVIIMNEASIKTSIVLFDFQKDAKPLGFVIDKRSIQTLVY